MSRTQFLDERLFNGKGKGGSGGKGAGKHAAAQLAAAAQQADDMAEEARRNREKVKAEAQEREIAKQAKSQAASSGFVGNADVFEFAAETSFMQGRDDFHMDRHVMVKDLVAASKALKMPIDTLDKPVALFSVYDGHVGPKCSEYCAQNFHKKLLPRLSKVSSRREQSVEQQIRASLVSALAELDQEFITKFRTDRSGCTTQIALLVGRRLYVAGLGGEANTVLCSSTEGASATALWTAEALHSPVLLSNPEEEERVKAAGGSIIEVAPGVQHLAAADFEARMRDYRIQMASGLGCSGSPPMSSPFLRSLGDRELKTPKSILLPEPEVRTIWLERSHMAFVLFCDGVAEAMSTEDVCGLLQKHVGNEKRAASELTQEAYNKGSEQNLTAVTVFFRWPAKRTHDKTYAAPETAPEPAPAPAKAKAPVESPKKPQNAARQDAQAMKSAKRARTDRAAPSPAAAKAPPVVPVIELRPMREIPSFESLSAQWLESAGKLFQDDDGDVAHEFLEEDSLGQLSAVECLLSL